MKGTLLAVWCDLPCSMLRLDVHSGQGTKRGLLLSAWLQAVRRHVFCCWMLPRHALPSGRAQQGKMDFGCKRLCSGAPACEVRLRRIVVGPSWAFLQPAWLHAAPNCTWWRAAPGALLEASIRCYPAGGLGVVLGELPEKVGSLGRADILSKLSIAPKVSTVRPIYLGWALAASHALDSVTD